MKRFLETGNFAIAEGAIIGGCRFFAGYPITPATELAESMSLRLPQVGGVYLQAEDECAGHAPLHRGVAGRHEGHDRDLRPRLHSLCGPLWLGPGM